MKKYFALVLLIITAISIVKADNWTNAGEFSYLYPNSTKKITDYTLTEDGKNIVVITLDSSNKANNYYQYKLQRIDLETGAVEFDTLYKTTDQHKFILSRDGLTLFDIKYSIGDFDYEIYYSLVDIYHSSRGYLFQKYLADFQGDAKHKVKVNINFINFLYEKNILIHGASADYSTYSSFPPGYSNISKGTIKIFNIKDSIDLFEDIWGAPEFFDYYSNLKYFVYYQHYSTSGTSQNSSSNSSIVLVDSSKKKSSLFYSYNDSIPTQSLKLVGDSILIIRRDADKNNVIHYYNIKNKSFFFRYKFPFFDYNKNTKISFSNDGQYFIKTAPNKQLQFYKSGYYYPIAEIPQPSELSNFKEFKFSSDDKYIITVNNDNQFVRLDNPFKSNKLNAYFTINDTVLLSSKTYKPINLSSGQPVSYSWDFGNGSVSNEYEPKFNFFYPGKYTIRLSVEKNGEYSTQKKEVTVLSNFKCGFEIVKIPEYTPIVCEFKNTSSDNIDSLIWDFGDGTFSKSKEVKISHTYKIEKEFNVKLKVFYKQLCDSIEKKVLIKGIKQLPLELKNTTELDFDNQKLTNCKINTIYETSDSGYIIVDLVGGKNENEYRSIFYKTSNTFEISKKLILESPLKFNDFPDNYTNLHFNNSIKINNNRYITFSIDSIRIFDDQLNKISSNKIEKGFNIHLIDLPKFWSDTSHKIKLIYDYSSKLFLGDYDIISGKYNSTEPIQISETYLSGYEFLKQFTYYLSYTPLNDNISYYSSWSIRWHTSKSSTNHVFTKGTVNLKVFNPFVTYSNINGNSFVGLDTLGRIYKFDTNGDSLNIITLTKGLVNIAVNKSLYYAVGSKEGHPICYIFDNELNMKDTIYIPQRDGAFETALICNNGDLVLAGYNYQPTKYNTKGKLLQSSYILKIENFTDPLGIFENNTKVIPNISITNPIDHLATIRLAVDSITTFHYEAYDFLGNLVFKSAYEKIEKEYTGTVDFSGLAPGVYIFKFYINGIIETKKVIYQK